MNPILVDTGPLVAVIRKKDRDHERCRRFMAGVTVPLLTTWPVLTEAAWLLREDGRFVSALLSMVSGGRLQVDPLGPEAAGTTEAFLTKYADQKPQLADATLIYLADSLNLDTVFTLDRRDFSVYRKRDDTVLNMVPE